MIVTVNSLDPHYKAGSLWIFTGAAKDGTYPVSFAVEGRVGRELLEEIAAREEVECSVESWQIL